MCQTRRSTYSSICHTQYNVVFMTTTRGGREPDFFWCGLELRPGLSQILKGQGRAFGVSRPSALVDEG